MPKGTETLSSIEMRELILEALAIEDSHKTPRQNTFKMYGYRGSLDDLRAIVEYIAIERGLTDKIVEIPNAAWGGSGYIEWYGNNTNLNDHELDVFYEQIHFLVFQNVISPGARGNNSAYFPFFHVTEYGKKCLLQRDILPYDPDGYLNRLKQNPLFDEWDEFYISQSLLCYNSGAFEASVVMLGIAAEYLSERLVAALDGFLSMLEPVECKTFRSEIEKRNLASEKHAAFEKTLAKIEPRYRDLEALRRMSDNIAKDVYSTYLRLNRNALAHPNQFRIEKIECLSMFISYIKYCDTQLKYLQCLNSSVI